MESIRPRPFPTGPWKRIDFARMEQAKQNCPEYMDLLCIIEGRMLNITLYYFHFRSRSAVLSLRDLFRRKKNKKKTFLAFSLSTRILSFSLLNDHLSENEKKANLWSSRREWNKRHMEGPTCTGMMQSSLQGGILDPICKWYLRTKFRAWSEKTCRSSREISMKLNTFSARHRAAGSVGSWNWNKLDIKFRMNKTHRWCSQMITLRSDFGLKIHL